MKFEEIHSIVKGVPFISEQNARYIYDLIIREKPSSILELGVAHGTATCYMAAALHENGVGGRITSVDLIEAKSNFIPTAEEQLVKAGLAEFVSIVRMQSGYNWFLHDIIKEQSKNDVCEELYDLCIIDGPKNWTIDGAAFFMVEKLMKNNAWLIFDDYNWTYAHADTKREATDGIAHRSLSSDELATPHIREIFELLVKQHPRFGNFIILNDRNWALAQKSATPAKTYRINYNTSRSFLELLEKILKKIYSIIFHSNRMP